MLLGVLLVCIIIICIAMVAVILLQKSEGGALGMSGGGPGNFMTARGAGDLLTRTTEVLAALFLLLCLAMTMLSGHNHAASITDRMKIGGITPPPAAPAEAPAAPANDQTTAPSTALPPAAPAQQAPSAPVGVFGEKEGVAAKAKPAAPVNPLANMTVQSPPPAAPPASR